MSFYVDTSMKVKFLFDNWMTYIQNPTSRNFNYYDEYTADIVIEVQDIKNQSRYGIKLFEAYPKSIGAVQLDYAGKDVMKMSVNIAYKYYAIGTQEVLNTDAADGGFTPFNYQPVLDTKNDPLNAFATRLKNFAIGSIGAAAVSKIPGIIRR
jgi:hypothetical protein